MLEAAGASLCETLAEGVQIPGWEGLTSSSPTPRGVAIRGCSIRWGGIGCACAAGRRGGAALRWCGARWRLSPSRCRRWRGSSGLCSRGGQFLDSGDAQDQLYLMVGGPWQVDFRGRRNESYLAGFYVVIAGRKRGKHKLAALIGPAYPHLVGIGIGEADRRSRNGLASGGAHHAGRAGGRGRRRCCALRRRRGCLGWRWRLLSRYRDGCAKDCEHHASRAVSGPQISLAFP